jgi:hypothetical protein
MRDFSMVQTRFWIDPGMRALSRDSRLIALYLATGPHTTMLGCFRCPKSYIAEDLDCSLAIVEAGFAALSALDFFTYDEKTGWCVVHDFFKWNPIHNPSHALGVEKLFEQVPREGAVFQKCCALLQQSPKYLRAEFVKGLKTLCQTVTQTLTQTVSTGCGDPVQTVSRLSRHTDTDKDTDTETDTDTEKDTEIEEKRRKEQEEEVGVQEHIVAPARPGNRVNPDVIFVFEAWKTTLSHSQAVLDEKRRAWISRALKSGYSAEQLCQAIRGCSLTPYNMGKNERGQRYDGLHVILRDADQIERFMRNALSPPKERNAAEALVDSNQAVCDAWLQDKLSELAEVEHASV